MFSQLAPKEKRIHLYRFAHLYKKHVLLWKGRNHYYNSHINISCYLMIVLYLRTRRLLLLWLWSKAETRCAAENGAKVAESLTSPVLDVVRASTLTVCYWWRVDPSTVHFWMYKHNPLSCHFVDTSQSALLHLWCPAVLCKWWWPVFVLNVKTLFVKSTWPMAVGAHKGKVYSFKISY